MRPLRLTALACALLAGSGAAQEGRATAIRAGTIHLVEDGRVVRGGTILVRGGDIVAVGSELDVPPDAEVVDYGPDAVIVPGMVAAMSWYANGFPSKRTAAPGLRAVDGFDPYREYWDALAAGVTSAYLTPSDARLIAGQGALVKLAGDDHAARIVNDAAAVHGAVDAAARNTPGYWEPPLPVTVDVGIGHREPQLPGTTMGAIVALNELLEAGRAGAEDSPYGPSAPRELVELLGRGVPLRLGAVEENEIRAVLDFAARNELRVVLDKAHSAGDLADEIAAAGAGVVFRVPYSPNGSAQDLGKDEDARWYVFDAPAKLVAAGVPVAVTGTNPRDLAFAAGLATRGGLAPADALRAVTLEPARLLGGADRIGSLAPGKDADLVVLSGPPLQGSVTATWVDGRLAWSPELVAARRSDAAGKLVARRAAARAVPTVIEVDELHVGDGRVLAPGQLLLKDGKIAEVGARVSHPPGARVVRGRACMPGMIDALGHLGLEGSSKVPPTDFELTSIVDPGDDVDRRVAAHGITTVVLAPRGVSSSGAPLMAYKPAGSAVDEQVLGDPVALRVAWRESNRIQSGESVASLLEKAAEYRRKWQEYEVALAAWTPPPPEAEKDDEKDEDEDESEPDEEDEEEDDDKKKKKRKKKGEEELEPDPITGTWQTTLEEERFRLRLLFEAGEGSGPVEGNLRSDVLSETLIEVEGAWDREAKELTLAGRGSRGRVELDLKPDDEKLVGSVRVAGDSYELELERTSKEYPVARRPERRRVEEEKEKEPKGKPKEPKRDPKLEPVVRVLEGEATIVVDVQREDEIAACVELFERYGVRPVLYGADDAHHLAGSLADRVAGILLSARVVVYEAERGMDARTPYADLQAAGVPVAFHSGREEGAIDLPLRAAYAVANGMSPVGAVRALTADAAAMMSIDHRVGRLERGLDADVVLLDGPPLAPGTSVVRTWVNGEEVRP